MKQLGYFEINELPPTLNVHKHWAKKYKDVKRWKRLVAHQVLQNNIPRLHLKKATLVLTRHSSKETDFDNLYGSFKPVIDGLVEIGVLIDDNPNVIGLPICIWKKASPKLGKISVEILTAEDAPVDSV